MYSYSEHNAFYVGITISFSDYGIVNLGSGMATFKITTIHAEEEYGYIG